MVSIFDAGSYGTEFLKSFLYSTKLELQPRRFGRFKISFPKIRP